MYCVSLHFNLMLKLKMLKGPAQINCFKQSYIILDLIFVGPLHNTGVKSSLYYYLGLIYERKKLRMVYNVYCTLQMLIGNLLFFLIG